MSTVITRFFFKEILPLDEQFGEGAEYLKLPFAKLEELYQVRIYSSYLAVHCRPIHMDQIDSLTEKVVAIGVDALSRRFDWDSSLKIEYIEEEELGELRRREGVSGFTWVLGMG
jgi:hypothetical protein